MTDSPDSPGTPAPATTSSTVADVCAAPPVPAIPFSPQELRACLSQPLRTLDIVLAERHRLVASVCSGGGIALLLMVLVACSVVFALPFAAVDGPGQSARAATLFFGSTIICFPSLQVFGSYLGLRLTVTQNLALALVIPSAAALFTLGFFPIYWFLDATMPHDSVASSATSRVVLLGASLLLGLSHLNRCMFVDTTLQVLRACWPLWIGWQVLLLWITWRMAGTLGLFT